MLASFFESIKYVGHLVPVSFLRIYLGFYYLDLSLSQYHGDFLTRPKLAAQMTDWLPQSTAYGWFKYLVENYFITYWSIFCFVILTIEICIALSYIFGFVVRPVALLAIGMYFILLFAMGGVGEDYTKTLIAVHILMAWIGAGRCLGFDYYFYKRQRGLWW